MDHPPESSCSWPPGVTHYTQYGHVGISILYFKKRGTSSSLFGRLRNRAGGWGANSETDLWSRTSNNDAYYIFHGYAGMSTLVLRIEFRFSKSAYQVRVSLRNDSSGWTSSSWFNISDAPHAIELDWRAATASGANNGGLTFWLDGTQRASLSGVDNDMRRIDSVQLGPVSGIDSGTRGTYYFDAFESRRQSYIGP